MTRSYQYRCSSGTPTIPLTLDVRNSVQTKVFTELWFRSLGSHIALQRPAKSE